jgi:maltodextrin utilization protein YvdJ
MANIDPIRTAALDAAVARWARNGWTVSSVSGPSAVLQRKKRIGWFWNLLLTIVTGGLWLIVVVIRVINRKIETVILTVDEYARVHTS